MFAKCVWIRKCSSQRVFESRGTTVVVAPAAAAAATVAAPLVLQFLTYFSHRLQQETQDFMAMLRHYKLPLDAALSAAPVLTLEQVSLISEDNITLKSHC